MSKSRPDHTWMHPLLDEVLIGQLVVGERDEIRRFQRACFDILHRYLRMRSIPNQEWMDLTLEVVVDSWKFVQANPGVSPEKLTREIDRIADRVAQQEVRRGHRTRLVLDDDEEASVGLPTDNTTPEKLLEHRKAVARLSEIIDAAVQTMRGKYADLILAYLADPWEYNFESDAQRRRAFDAFRGALTAYCARMAAEFPDQATSYRVLLDQIEDVGGAKQLDGTIKDLFERIRDLEEN